MNFHITVSIDLIVGLFFGFVAGYLIGRMGRKFIKWFYIAIVILILGYIYYHFRVKIE